MWSAPGGIDVELISLSLASFPEGDGPYFTARQHGALIGRGYFRTAEALVQAIGGNEVARKLRPVTRIRKAR